MSLEVEFTENADLTEEKRYNFHDYVGPFRPEQMPQFKSPCEEGILVYRSCISWLPSEDDQTPLMLRKRPGKKIKPAFTYEAVDNMSDEKRFKEVCHLALSFNDSFEAAKNALDKKFQELKGKNLPKEQIDAFMEARGLYIGAFIINASHGLITDFTDGHGNILLYEGVKLKEMALPDFSPIKYEYEL